MRCSLASSDLDNECDSRYQKEKAERLCAGLSQDPLGQEVARMKQLFLHDRVVRSCACAST